jgi:hypothetical protein
VSFDYLDASVAEWLAFWIELVDADVVKWMAGSD